MMHHIPRYSVIMPAYNTGAYIAEAIESVFSQSVSDWELIIIDDGSTDNTAPIVRSFHDARIRFIQQANQGLSAVRNRGSQESRGPMLMFFDSDDRLRPAALERLGQALMSHPNACAAYGEGIVMDVYGKAFGKGPVFAPRPSGDILRTLLQRNLMLTGATLIRAGHFRKTTGFRPDLIVIEDWEMWCRLALIGEFLYIGKEPVFEYRIRPGSIMRTIDPEQGILQRLRGVDAVFSLPAVQQRFSARELAQLRRSREAAVFALTATTALLKRQWRPARRCLLACLRRQPFHPREIVLLSFALMHWLPFALERRLK